MSLVASFHNTTVEYRKVPKIKLALVKHDFYRGNFDMNFYPDTIEMQNEGKGFSKGDRIRVGTNWQNYSKKINSERGHNYLMSVGEMWMNPPQDGITPLAERIHCGGNFCSWDLETDTHVRLISFSNNYNTTTLNPLVDNWLNKPHLFWKACSVNIEGKVIKVANGLDVYFPLINDQLNRGLWMRKDRLVMFPEDGYTFKDGDVYLRGELFMRTGVVK